MTQRLQMIEPMAGTRWDGTPWPPAGGPVDVPDWEAEHLIRGRFARPWPGSAPAPEPQAPAPAEGSAPPAAPPSPGPDAAAGAEPPKATDPKTAWVEYAVAHGADRAEAEQSTKQDLIASYGGRP